MPRTWIVVACVVAVLTSSIEARERPIIVERPAGGEVYFPGQQQTVVLERRTRAKSVLIELSRDGGQTFVELGTIDNTIRDRNARNRLQWTVAEPFATNAVIRATSTDARKPGNGLSGSFCIGAANTDGSGTGLRFVLRSGDSMTGPLTLSGDPTTGLHASTKTYVDNANAGQDAAQATRDGTQDTGIASKVAKAGDTMTGPLVLSGDPTVDLHPATKKYVDDANGAQDTAQATTDAAQDTVIAGKLSVTGGTMTGFLTLDADPTANLHAATKQYVDTRAGTAWGITGNSGTNPSGNFLGTIDNQPLEIRVYNQRTLRLERHVEAPNIIGGHQGNYIAAGVYGATISGGGGTNQDSNLRVNRVTSNYGTVSGGTDNQAGADSAAPSVGGFATVGGGVLNAAKGNWSTVGGGSGNVASSHQSTVGGGGGNQASGSNSTITGGMLNEASGTASVVGGGEHNMATSFASCVPGGAQNTAAGGWSLAAGNQAKALHNGVFVWADSTDAPFSSTSQDQFLIRAGGGVGIGTNSPTARLSLGTLSHTDVLHVYDDGNNKYGFGIAGGELQIYCPDQVNDHISFGTRSTSDGQFVQNMRLNSNGDLGVVGSVSISGVGDLRLNRTDIRTASIVRGNYTPGVADRLAIQRNGGGSIDRLTLIADLTHVDGKLGVGTTNPGTSALKVAGTIETVDPSGGVKFPDGTTQTTALVGAGVPPGFFILGETATPPTGFSYSGFSFDIGFWTPRAPMPTARYRHAVVALNGKIYVLGGEYTNINEEYDPATNTWTTKTPMPTVRSLLAVEAVDGKIYAIGGHGDGSGELSVHEVYDPGTDSWSTGTPIPTARYSCASAVVGGKIYVFGGTDGSSSLNSVEAYDPATDSWDTKAPMPTARHELAAAVANGKVYVVGGSNGGTRCSINEEYDPVANTWTAKTPMHYTRTEFVAGELNGKVIAVCGTSPTSNAIEAYDPATNSWKPIAPMPTLRHHSGGTVVDGKFYIIGGNDGGGSVKTNEAFTEKLYYVHKKD